jgi:hypothetical protein
VRAALALRALSIDARVAAIDRVAESWLAPDSAVARPRAAELPISTAIHRRRSRSLTNL